VESQHGRSGQLRLFDDGFSIDLDELRIVSDELMTRSHSSPRTLEACAPRETKPAASETAAKRAA
jgi:hypothetical protein